MSTIRRRGEEISKFIVDNVADNPAGIAALVSVKFEISRQAANKHLKRMVEQGVLCATGDTRNRQYSFCALKTWEKTYLLGGSLTEDVVWRELQEQIGDLPDNVIDIWHYGITEMFNNVIDHSGGKKAVVTFEKTAGFSTVLISDDGVGIFRKIQAALKFHDERHSVLELAKGKLTTDPDNHTGEGIFFSSRTFDQFRIFSGAVFFAHDFEEPEDWIINRIDGKRGTGVFMRLQNNTARTLKQVFDRFTDDDYSFSKTIVPVRLAEYGDDKLVSRSQAKRVLSGLNKFSMVLLDFAGVETIGQAFADEVFRVYARHHPEIELSTINVSEQVERMINRAKNHD
ncbi:MAG TPA: DUF4325 domain-containing protein [Thiolinea sp.]|nr:DUF4325 domain-containing protein [Thiolinea sp.]